MAAPQQRTPCLDTATCRTLVAAASMAPSVLNTQPWSFERDADVLRLYADRDRALNAAIDPVGRQLVVSCGAALFNVRVAAASLGRHVEIEPVPDPADPELLAVVRVARPDGAQHADAELAPMIRHRHTYRRPFTPKSVPGPVLAELIRAAHHEQATLRIIDRAERPWLYDLICYAELMLADDPRYEEELLHWTGGGSRRRDGVPMSAFGTRPVDGTPPMRDFGRGRPMLHISAERYGDDPCIAVLTTTADDTRAWLQAGQALQRVLLLARARGIAASFLNQVVDAADVRHELCVPESSGFAQMVLRMGYADGGVSTPRRRVEELLRTRSH